MKQHDNLTSLVDALGALRDQIAALKAREAELGRAALDAARGGEIVGTQFALSVREETRKRFDPSNLPPHIRENPRYWAVTRRQSAVTQPIPGTTTDATL